MTLVVIGPVTKDLIVIGDEKTHKIGGATYFQSFVFENFYNDYLAIVNCSDEDLVKEFPDSEKVKAILKDDTHYFINNYPNPDDLDIRNQLSNFANIPILKSDLEKVLPKNIDAFVLKFLSIQGFLRIPDMQVNENFTIKLDNFDELNDVLRGVSAIFLDEAEENIIGTDYDVDEMVITDGSNGSRIISTSQIKIDAVKCDNIVDTTGSGDTYMASYISHRLNGNSIKQSGDFASYITSEKLKKPNHF